MNRRGTATVTTIATPDAPEPMGHYVQATACEGLLFVSGQLAVKPDGTHTVDSDFQAQALQALTNVLSIVKAAGGSPEVILKMTAYIVGVENWPTFNRVYREVLGDARPARSVVPVPALHHGYLIELDAVAICGNSSMLLGGNHDG